MTNSPAIQLGELEEQKTRRLENQHIWKPEDKRIDKKIRKTDDQMPRRSGKSVNHNTRRSLD